jgi:hypothetical protein
MNRIFFVSLAAMGLFCATPALSQDCDAEQAAVSVAQDELEAAEDAVEAYDDSYDYRSNVILAMYYIMSSQCGSDYLCHIGAIEDRDWAISDLDSEGVNLRFDVPIKQSALLDAEFAFYTCLAT